MGKIAPIENHYFKSSACNAMCNNTNILCKANMENVF